MFQRFAGLFTRDKPVQSRGLLLGLDNAGKTTLLYKLRGGTVTTTIPTIGFNIETVETPSWKFECWDVGGCDKTRPLQLQYVTNAQFLVFVHDCTDEDRLVESIQELQEMIHALDQKAEKHVFVLLNKQDLLKDEIRSKRVGEVRQRFEKAVQGGRPSLYIEIMDLPGLSCKTGYQLDHALARMKDVLTGTTSQTTAAKPISSYIEKAAPLPPSLTEAQLIGRIRQADAASETADVFWNSFLNAELRTWDHFTHLRAGYFVMIDEMSMGKSIFECADAFISHLERLRSAKPDHFRNTEHRSMTIFWLVQLHSAAISYSADRDGRKILPHKDKFSAVLSHSPQLMNSGLWRDYYTKEAMFSPAAKGAWHTPDLQPLPSNLNIGASPITEKS